MYFKREQVVDLETYGLTFANGNSDIQFKFHHVACAVRNTTDSIDFYTKFFGFKLVSGPFEVPSQKVKVTFLDMGGGTLFELVEGTSVDSPIKSILDTPGGGIYHVCYQVPKLDEAVNFLRSKGCFLITRVEQFDNKDFRYVFMLTPEKQLFELCELK